MKTYELILTKFSSIIIYQQQNILELRILLLSLSIIQSYSNKNSVISKGLKLVREYENTVKLKLKALFYNNTM